jgi:hypothetical protein
MKRMILLMMMYGATVQCTDEESLQTIKQEYGNIIDALYATMHERADQHHDGLDTASFIAFYKHHLDALQGCMSDLNIALSFNVKERKKMNVQLHECLKDKVAHEAQLLFESNDLHTTKIDDFLCLSKIMCGVTQESDELCTRMVDGVRKDWALMLKKLDIIELTQAQVDAKIKRLDEHEDKKIKRAELYKHIMLGAHQHKNN